MRDHNIDVDNWLETQELRDQIINKERQIARLREEIEVLQHRLAKLAPAP